MISGLGRQLRRQNTCQSTRILRDSILRIYFKKQNNPDVMTLGKQRQIPGPLDSHLNLLGNSQTNEISCVREEIDSLQWTTWVIPLTHTHTHTHTQLLTHSHAMISKRIKTSRWMRWEKSVQFLDKKVNKNRLKAQHWPVGKSMVHLFFY